MKIVYFLFILLLLNSCGSSSDSNNSSVQSNQYNEYLWHLFFTDNDFSTIYGIDANSSINAKEAWQLSRGAGVKIAVIDDSFEATHEDIVNNVVTTYNTVTGTSDVSGDIASHGTICAGHVAAEDNLVGIVGIAPEAELVLIKYGESDMSIIMAFNKAVEEGVKVISCSWGTYDVSQAIANKLQEVHNLGITIVFAVGNDGLSLDGDINDESESAYVIAVGASCENNDVCSYSNYGSALDVIAPGGDTIESAGVLGLDHSGESGSDEQRNIVNNNYAFKSGTSFSTPLVAGVVALMYSVDENLTPLEARSKLILNTQKVGLGVYYDSDGFNIKRGYGKVDAYQALNSML